MIEKRYDTLAGLSAPILIYTLEDFLSADEIAALTPTGRANLEKLNNESNNNLVYRGVLPVVRESVANILEAETGVEWPKKQVGTKADKITPIYQYKAEGKYADDVMAVKGWNDLKALQSQVDELCRNFRSKEEVEANKPGTPLAVDINGTERKAAGPKKLALKYKQSAAVLITNGKIDAINSGQLANIGKTFTATNDTSKMFTGKASIKTAKVDEAGKPVYVDVDYNVSDKDAEALGWLWKEYLDWKAAQVSEEALAQ